jgi:hypothetical protein
MGTHPVNLAVRFILEICALAAMAYWGWTQHAGWLRFVLAIGLPVLAASVWGTFAVANDPSRSGNAPVPTPGIIRLILELGFFGLAIWMLYNAGAGWFSLIMGVTVLIHYILSYDRIGWLLKQ